MTDEATFNFNSDDFKRHCIAKQKYLKNCFGKNITLDQFVKDINSMPKHLHWSHTHSPNAAKKMYMRLEKKYNFFKENEE